MEYLTKMMRDETINKGPITIASSLATAWRGWRWTSTSLYGKEGTEQERGKRANEMVCCQPSGKNDPEQIAASFPRQGGAEGEGGGRRASERTDFPHSAYDIRRPRPSALTRPPAAADDRARSVSSSSSPRRPRPKHCRMFYGIVDCRRMSGWVSRGFSRL